MRNPRKSGTPGLRLRELLRGVRPARIVNEADPVIPALSDDSRRVVSGTLFVAVDGALEDGHSHIPSAVENSAGAIVCEDLPRPMPHCPVIQVADSRRALSRLAHNFFGHPSSLLRMTGVTGTNGKTSTVEILREVLNEAGREAGSVGTLGYCYSGRRLDSDLTTPDPISLHDALSRMWLAGLTDVCMEASSQALVQHRVADVDFDAAILTNITQDHLDTHGTRENYALAKRMLFEGLGPSSVAILPAGGEFTDMFQQVCAGPVLTYGMGRDADVSGWIIDHGMNGMELAIHTPFESYRVQTALTGEYNCLNILAAATAAFSYGIDGATVAAALRGLRGVPGRLEQIRVPGRMDLPAVCVDFAHTPDALMRVLETLRPLVRGQLTCLVGCGGDRDTTKRPTMGRIAAELADLVVFTADNSRSERTEDIIDEMIAGIPPGRHNYRVEPERRRALVMAIHLTPSEDSMVVICGRGCEKYLKIGEGRVPFDDRVVAREVMAETPLRRRRIA